MGCNISNSRRTKKISQDILLDCCEIAYNSDIVLNRFFIKLIIDNQWKYNTRFDKLKMNMKDINNLLEQHSNHETPYNIKSSHTLSLRKLINADFQETIIEINKKKNKKNLKITIINSYDLPLSFDIVQKKIVIYSNDIDIILHTDIHDTKYIRDKYTEVKNSNLFSMSLLEGEILPTIISKKDNMYKLYPLNNVFPRISQIYRYIGDKKMKTNIQTLSLGDILLISSIKILIYEIKKYGVLNELDRNDLNSSEYCEEIIKSFPEKTFGKVYENNITKKIPHCYICLENTHTDQDPLLSACSCIGETQWLHFECLKKLNNIWVERNNEFIYEDKHPKEKITCKICNTKYHSHIQTSDGKIRSLIKPEFEEDHISFIIISKHKSNQKLFRTRYHFVLEKNNKIKNKPYTMLIGRSTRCDLQINYMGLSSLNSRISFIDNKFIIEDCSSLNGTLILQKDVYNIKEKTKFRFGENIVAIESFLINQNIKNNEKINFKNTNIKKKKKNIKKIYAHSDSFEDIIYKILKEVREENFINDKYDLSNHSYNMYNFNN